MATDEIFTGDRMVSSSMTDTWYVVTKWRNLDGNMIDAIEKREATEEDADRINARRSQPNVEHWTGDEEGRGARHFVCRECTVEFPDSGGLIKDRCPGCGETVGFVRKSWMRMSR